MYCKICHSDLQIVFCTKSLATTMSYQCDCCDSSESVQHEERGSDFPLNRILTGLLRRNQAKKERTSLSCAKPHDFLINNILLLSILHNGGGFQAAPNFCGFISLKKPFTATTHRSNENRIYTEIEKLTVQILQENCQRKHDTSPTIDGEKDMVCSFNIAWQQRGSGNEYDSSSRYFFSQIMFQ